MFNILTNESFEESEVVEIQIGSRTEKAIFDCQTTYSSDPMRDRFRVKIGKNFEYVSRREIKKI